MEQHTLELSQCMVSSILNHAKEESDLKMYADHMWALALVCKDFHTEVRRLSKDFIADYANVRRGQHEDVIERRLRVQARREDLVSIFPSTQDDQGNELAEQKFEESLDLLLSCCFTHLFGQISFYIGERYEARRPSCGAIRWERLLDLMHDFLPWIHTFHAQTGLTLATAGASFAYGLVRYASVNRLVSTLKKEQAGYRLVGVQKWRLKKNGTATTLFSVCLEVVWRKRDRTVGSVVLSLSLENFGIFKVNEGLPPLKDSHEAIKNVLRDARKGLDEKTLLSRFNNGAVLFGDEDGLCGLLKLTKTSVFPEIHKISIAIASNKTLPVQNKKFPCIHGSPKRGCVFVECSCCSRKERVAPKRKRAHSVYSDDSSSDEEVSL